MKKKKQSQQKTSRKLLYLPLVLACIAFVAIGSIFISRKSANQQNLQCQYTVSHTYPPALGFNPTQEEVDNWVNGYQDDDALGHVKWANSLLANSAFPIGPETLHFINDNPDVVMFNIQSITSGAFGFVRPKAGKLVININKDLIAGPKRVHSYYLLMTIVHETVHAEQMLMKGKQIAKEENISLSDAFDKVYHRQEIDTTEWLCNEMEAFARETAFYDQLESSHTMTTSSYYEEMLKTLTNANWDWTAKSWLAFIQKTSPEYVRN